MMKSFLLALMVLFAIAPASHADRVVEDTLLPADELVALDSIADEGWTDNDIDSLHPRPRPYPRPYPRPPRPPRPPYPPHHPVPPPPSYRWYECASQDVWGQVYYERGRNPRFVQDEAHRQCVAHSNGPCRDLGCRRY